MQNKLQSANSSYIETVRQKSMFGVNFGKNAKIQKNRKEFRKQHSE